MPDIEVTNGSRLEKAFRASGGLETVKPNETKVLRDANIPDAIRAQCEAEGVKFSDVGEGAELPEGPLKDLEEMRKLYFDQTGKHADGRWKAERILDELTKGEE
jgi:hypothetical protein